jgi:DNA-binding PadR family transcriptional regulator
MKDEGLLTCEIKYQDSLPNSKIYHITDRGKAELRRWLAEPLEPHQYRNAFLIKIFFGTNVEPEAIITQLEQRLEAAETNLKNYKKNMARIMEEQDSQGCLTRKGLFWSLTADFGIRHEEALIAWYKESIQKLHIMKNSRESNDCDRQQKGR